MKAGSGRPEVLLKVLQIVLQLANSLSAEPSSVQYLSETTLNGMLFLGMTLCEIKVMCPFHPLHLLQYVN